MEGLGAPWGRMGSIGGGQGGISWFLEAFMTYSMALAMASGQEVTAIPCWRMVEGQRIPLS